MGANVATTATPHVFHAGSLVQPSYQEMKINGIELRHRAAIVFLICLACIVVDVCACAVRVACSHCTLFNAQIVVLCRCINTGSTPPKLKRIKIRFKLIIFICGSSACRSPSRSIRWFAPPVRTCARQNQQSTIEIDAESRHFVLIIRLNQLIGPNRHSAYSATIDARSLNFHANAIDHHESRIGET